MPPTRNSNNYYSRLCIPVNQRDLDDAWRITGCQTSQPEQPGTLRVIRSPYEPVRAFVGPRGSPISHPDQSGFCVSGGWFFNRPHCDQDG